jgi:hypothetical protein
MLRFVLLRQLKILVREFLRLLYEPMEKNHSLLRIDIKNNAGDAVSRQLCSDFMETVTQSSCHWHPDWPT